MSCTVAMSNSPVFSPSSSSKISSFFSSSPETLKLTHSPSSSPSSSSFKLRLHKPPPSGLVRASNDVVTASSSSSEVSPTLSKRKRPAKLDIPVSDWSFGSDVAEEDPRKEVAEMEGDGYSVYCKRGRREAMEDRYSANVDIQGHSKQAFFGIFDGHGGAKAAEFAAENLEKNILDELGKQGDQDMGEVVKHGYLKTDSEFLKQDSRGGSCCVTAIIRKGNLVVSNAGDCRAVVSKAGVAEALTSDHRPSREDEKSRIEALGGYVDCCHGVWRIQGSLAVSRGIGDRHLKQWITAEPETKILRIEPEFEFLILASDGLWDKVSNQEAVDVVHANYSGIDKLDQLSTCKKLADLSVSRGSSDDISVMLVRLGRFC